MDVQKRIRDLMKLRGWTDYRLAKEASLSHSTVTNMFNRNNAPTLPTLEAVCRAFGITLAQFFADEVDPGQLTDEQRTLCVLYTSPSPRDRLESRMPSPACKKRTVGTGNYFLLSATARSALLAYSSTMENRY